MEDCLHRHGSKEYCPNTYLYTKCRFTSKQLDADACVLKGILFLSVFRGGFRNKVHLLGLFSLWKLLGCSVGPFAFKISLCCINLEQEPSGPRWVPIPFIH
jgi:hypothetical protein